MTTMTHDFAGPLARPARHAHRATPQTTRHSPVLTREELQRLVLQLLG